MAWLIFNISSIFVQTWCILTHFEMCKVSRWSNNIPETFWDAMWELRLGHSWPDLRSESPHRTVNTTTQPASKISLEESLKCSKHFQHYWKVWRSRGLMESVILHRHIYHLQMNHPILPPPLSRLALLALYFAFILQNSWFALIRWKYNFKPKMTSR